MKRQKRWRREMQRYKRRRREMQREKKRRREVRVSYVVSQVVECFSGLKVGNGQEKGPDIVPQASES